MTLTEFYQAVEAHKELTGVGIDVTNRSIKIRNNMDNLVRIVSFNDVVNNNWAHLEQMLTNDVGDVFSGGDLL